MVKMILLISLLTLTMNLHAPEYRTLPVERSAGIWYVSMGDVSQLLLKHQIKYPEIVKRQIILETGYLTSDILKQNHNLIGMGFAPTRETTAIGELNNCALYLNIEDCIKDLKIWQTLYFQRGGSYFDFLQRIGYAEDKKYIEKLKQIKL